MGEGGRFELGERAGRAGGYVAVAVEFGGGEGTAEAFVRVGVEIVVVFVVCVMVAVLRKSLIATPMRRVQMPLIVRRNRARIATQCTCRTRQGPRSGGAALALWSRLAHEGILFRGFALALFTDGVHGR